MENATPFPKFRLRIGDRMSDRFVICGLFIRVATRDARASTDSVLTAVLSMRNLGAWDLMLIHHGFSRCERYRKTILMYHRRPIVLKEAGKHSL